MGGITWATNYDPYGLPFEQYVDTASALGFTGEFTDPSGLLYLRARYYQPELGAFLSRDPFEGVMGRVVSRNGYLYTEGNPVNYTDPSGEFPFAALAVPVLFGAVAGAASALGFLALAATGACGCELKDWAENANVGELLLHGAIFGAASGL